MPEIWLKPDFIAWFLLKWSLRGKWGLGCIDAKAAKRPLYPSSLTPGVIQTVRSQKAILLPASNGSALNPSALGCGKEVHVGWPAHPVGWRLGVVLCLNCISVPLMELVTFLAGFWLLQGAVPAQSVPAASLFPGNGFWVQELSAAHAVLLKVKP